MTIFLVGALGIIFGSFVNALVWRLHEQETLKAGSKGKHQKHGGAQQATLTAQDLSIARGRSMCPQCHHTLAAKDLVPVLSWLSLRGRCRYCRTSISWQYPVVEILTGAVFVWSYLAWPYELHGLGLFRLAVWLACVVAFAALTVYDVRWMLLPDRIVLPLTLLAGLQAVVAALWTRDWAQLYVPLLSAAVIFGLFWVLFQVSKGAWIGGGDVKLAVALGLLAATPLRACLVIFVASLLGTLISIPLMLRGKRGLETHIPFGPYLLAATVVVVLYGPAIVQWYQNQLLL